MRYLLVMFLFFVATGCSQEPAGSSGGAGIRPDVAAKQALPSGRIMRAGIFSRVSGGTPVASNKSSTGKALSNLVMTFIRETDRVPISKDRILGYQYRLSNLPETGTVTLRRVLQHPEFHLPDGRITTGSDYVMTKRVERHEVFAYDIYALNEEYEMVPGDWTFQIWYGDNMLLEQKFTTYWGEDEEDMQADAAEPASPPDHTALEAAREALVSGANAD